MERTTITDYGNIKILEFNKMEQFKDKARVIVSLKTYNNDFRKTKDFNITNSKYKNIANVLNIEPDEILIPKQAHTSNIEIIKNKKKHSLQNIDGIITDVKNIPISITFADCIPLFFYDPVNNVIANIHSGWKGTVQKIAEKTIHKLISEYNSKPQNIICLIGPCIRKDHFLVNNDVKEIFESKFYDFSKKYDIISKTDKANEKGIQYEIDAVLVNKLMLINDGLLKENIIDSQICTVCSRDQFHSRRVEGINYAANTGIMMLK